MFALFPFLHATSYSAKLVSCSQDQIVLKSQDSEFRVSLFNTKITKEEGWQKTCELLEDATSILPARSKSRFPCICSLMISWYRRS